MLATFPFEKNDETNTEYENNESPYKKKYKKIKILFELVNIGIKSNVIRPLSTSMTTK